MTREINRRNLDIRAAAKSAGVYLWEIAEKLDVSEPTFNRYLRKELSDGWKQKLLAAIEDVKREHENERGKSDEDAPTSEPTAEQQTDG